MPTTITTTDIVTEYGKYYEQAGQNLARLKRSLTQPTVTLEKYGTHIRTNDTIYRMANFIGQPLLQPYQHNFTPNGGVEFIPNQINLRQMKVDVSLAPDSIEESWLGFLAGRNSKSLRDWPIVRWMLEEYIAKQIQEDLELNAVYKGVYNASGTTPSTTMDGLKKQLIDGVANTDYPINKVTGIGALTEATIFDQIEAFDEAIPSLYVGRPVVIFVSPKWARYYKKNKRTNNFYVVENAADIDATVDFTNHVVAGLPSMAETDDMFATLKTNILHLTKRSLSSVNVKVQEIHRDVDILIDMWQAVGFGCNKEVWVTAETVTTSTPTEP